MVLIVIYGYYGLGREPFREDCGEELENIKKVWESDPRLLRLSNIRIDLVRNLPFSEESPHPDSEEYGKWIKRKSNFYLVNSGFNAIFILQGCDNSTPYKEAEFAMDNSLQYKTLIFLEMREGEGYNSAGSMYIHETWNEKYSDIPIEYFNYKDFKWALNQVMGKLLSIE